MIFPPRTTCEKPSSSARSSAWRRAGSLTGEHGDDLIEVAAGGGAGDAVITGEGVAGGAVATPSQHRHGLPEAGQRPAAARVPRLGPLCRQQLRDELQQFPGDVKAWHDGRLRGAFHPEDDLWQDLFYGGSAPISRQPGLFVCLPGYSVGKRKPGCPNLFR